ncbi:MAG: uracil-DNA glycosylase [Trinickia sp.]|uniref:uracil-DNA glycosylase n=1 Tax=Trinickia sp. TaxID=2571163 RepID=UPI003F7D3DB1
MPLDEAALETLGLGTLWVRRGASIEPEPAQDDPVAQPEPHAASAAAVSAPKAVRTPAPRETARGPEPARSGAVAPSAPPAPRVKPEPPVEEPAWDDSAHPHAHAPLALAEPPGAGAAGGVVTLDWASLEARVSACERCRLCEKRTQTVFGVGDRAAEWMLIGEAPGENEDKQGEPFVGQAGKLLDSMLRALSLARGDNVYIANVVKCRPPGNRNPEPDEVARCEPYLQRQVALVKPKLIVALGRVAAQNLLKTDASISSLRGRVHRYEDVPVIVTYHPAYLLRSLPDKAKAWVDLCLAHDTYRQVLDKGQAPL